MVGPMSDSLLYGWLSFGAFLVFAELLLPGLVSVFLGLGALTVALLMHLNYIDNFPSQLIAWFVSSTVYIFTLRLLVMRYYPSDTEKQSIDEDQAMIGKVVEVIEKISGQGGGRISEGDSTWAAISANKLEIEVGEKVEIVGRENISWVVKKTPQEKG